MHRPLIVTTGGNDPERYYLRKEYITELERAGGAPLHIASSETASASAVYKIMDGLCLTGGDDIHPSFFGEEIAPHYTGTIDMKRDQLERELILYALDNNIPILGICRGMQALNVFLGGSLYQDILEERSGALNHKQSSTERATRTHSIRITENSLLSTIMNGQEFMVNSIHHQGIKQLGNGLIATATSPDGLIEAIEIPNHVFTLGVEWHPEELQDVPSRRIFEYFIDAARQVRR